jgi:hypothetical protein
MKKPEPASLKSATEAVSRLWWWADVTIEVEAASKAEEIRWREAQKSWASDVMRR